MGRLIFLAAGPFRGSNHRQALRYSVTPTRTYPNVEGRLPQAAEAVSALGGQVTKAIHEIGPHGFCALVFDSEGNRIPLYAPVIQPFA